MGRRARQIVHGALRSTARAARLRAGRSTAWGRVGRLLLRGDPAAIDTVVAAPAHAATYRLDQRTPGPDLRARRTSGAGTVQTAAHRAGHARHAPSRPA